MIAGAAIGAGEAAGDPLDQRFLVDHQLDHMVERAAALAEQDLERLGLVPGARIAVEDRALLGAAVEPLADQRRDDRVADQLAAHPSPPWP